MTDYFKDRKYILLVVLLFSIISVSQRLYFYPNMSAPLHVFFFGILFFTFLIGWEFIVLLGSILEKYFPVENNINKRFILQVVISFLFLFHFQFIIFYFLESLFTINEVSAYDEIDIITPAFSLFRVLVFNLIYFGGFYFKEWKRNLIRSERLQREQAEVRYNALRNQLNPHFLFNALTSLNSLIFENQELASDFLKQLSKVYRYTLQNRESEVVSLKKEIEFIEHYISLLKTRFGNAINISSNIGQAELDKRIVPVTTQMLIENAVKHNIISKAKPLNISITAIDEFLIVTNNINRKSQIETSNRLGLENLKGLYQYLSPTPIEINETESHFTIKIPLI
ncbi:MAG: histidine kinase [Cyclobacteriaceae bacterium]